MDIVLRTSALFYYNLDALPETQKSLFKADHPNKSDYDLPNLRKEVEAWLFRNYAGELDSSGKKALRLKAAGGRRNADVLLVAPHKKYTRYLGARPEQQAFLEGVLFMTTDGRHITNYPRQHSDRDPTRYARSR